MSAAGYTTGYAFTLINYQTQGWHTEEYANWRKLDALLASQLDAAIPFAVASGSVNAYVLNYTPDITSYTVGLLISFSPNLANTGAATVNVDGLGAKSLYRDGAALVGGELDPSVYVKAIYDGTKFIVIEPKNTDITIADASIAHTKLTTGHPAWDSSGNQTIAGNIAADGSIKTGDHLVLSHNDTAKTSAHIFFSTSDPSGGADGDIWFKHAA